MLKVALTGGIGTGKSTAADFLLHLGIPVLDTDRVARDLVQPGSAALDEIVHAFGPQVLDPAGHLRRDVLARTVFADEPARRRLEVILHPRIRDVWQRQLQDWARTGHARAVVVIPLLFEVGAAPEFDLSICLACSPDTQWQRLRSRGWSDEEIQRRIDAQWPLARKTEAADRVVWNEAGFSLLQGQLQRLFPPQPAVQ